MKEITDNEMRMVLSIVKSPKMEYNSFNLAKLLGMSAMGSFKIAQRLEKEGILESKKMGNAKFLRVRMEDDYAYQYVKFLLKREAAIAPPYVRVWIDDIRGFKNAHAAVLFGSILRKGKDANDIDVLFVVDMKNYRALKKEIDELNDIRTKRIHPMYQVPEDIKKNILKEDPPLLNALKGIYVSGEDIILKEAKL